MGWYDADEVKGWTVVCGILKFIENTPVDKLRDKVTIVIQS